ncbi:GLPGLI family protein [Chitinophaga jiangningensis]|nr:GLPGLI family protein [Chitinophaga jiangningensis]
MKMKMLLGILLSMCLGQLVKAQEAMFFTTGRIEFEKRTNVHAVLKEMNKDDPDNGWVQLQLQRLPQFTTQYFDCWFTDSITLYRPGRESPDMKNAREFPANDNIVYNVLSSGRTVSQKHVFEQTFLIQDSLRNISWKITDERRNIAGFDCRRANAVIMDSIYVVAFFTDQIIPPGGPESFTGLPGMILGVALPHEHITWFATKVLVESIPADQLLPQKKGKKVTREQLHNDLSAALAEKGNYGKYYIKFAEL